MNLKKAIKELTDLAAEPEMKPYTEYCQAIKLGIEALKRIKSDRCQVVPLFLIKLPGETEE